MPVIGGLIRQVPGTISLGQGVVHYGPPPAGARRGARRARPTRRRTSTRTAPACRRCVERLARKLRARERHRRRARQPRHGDRRREHGVHARGARDHRAGRRDHPATCRSTSTTRWRFRWPAAARCASPTDERYQLRLDALRAAITDRTRAIVTISPNNPSGAVLQRSGAARRSTRSAASAGIYHIADEVYEYFTYGSARHVSPGSFPGADGAHHLDVLAVEGVRLRRLAHRLHGVSRSTSTAAMVKSQDTILVCPPVVVAGRARSPRSRSGRAYCEPHVRELAAIRDIVVSRAVGAGAARERAGGRRRVLLPAAGRTPTLDPMAHRRAADPRAQGRGDSRAGVRHDRRLLLPRRVRRAAEGDGRRRHRPAGRRPARDSAS